MRTFAGAKAPRRPPLSQPRLRARLRMSSLRKQAAIGCVLLLSIISVAPAHPTSHVASAGTEEVDASPLSPNASRRIDELEAPGRGNTTAPPAKDDAPWNFTRPGPVASGGRAEPFHHDNNMASATARHLEFSATPVVPGRMTYTGLLSREFLSSRCNDCLSETLSHVWEISGAGRYVRARANDFNTIWRFMVNCYTSASSVKDYLGCTASSCNALQTATIGEATELVAGAMVSMIPLEDVCARCSQTVRDRISVDVTETLRPGSQMEAATRAATNEAQDRACNAIRMGSHTGGCTPSIRVRGVNPCMGLKVGMAAIGGAELASQYVNEDMSSAVPIGDIAQSIADPAHAGLMAARIAEVPAGSRGFAYRKISSSARCNFATTAPLVARAAASQGVATKICWGKLEHKAVEGNYATAAGLTLAECKERCENNQQSGWSGCVGFSRYRSVADNAQGTCWWVSSTANLKPSGASSYDTNENLYVLGRGGCAVGGGYCNDWQQHGETTGATIDTCAARCHNVNAAAGGHNLQVESSRRQGVYYPIGMAAGCAGFAVMAGGNRACRLSSSGCRARTGSENEWVSFTVPAAEEPLGTFGATSHRLQIGLCALACKNTQGCSIFSFGKSEAEQGKCLWSKACAHGWESYAVANGMVSTPTVGVNAREWERSGANIDYGGLLQTPPYVVRDLDYDMYQVSSGQNFDVITHATTCRNWVCDFPDQFCPATAPGSGRSNDPETGFSGYCCSASYRAATPASCDSGLATAGDGPTGAEGLTGGAATAGAAAETLLRQRNGDIRGNRNNLNAAACQKCPNPGTRRAGEQCREWDMIWAPAQWADGSIEGRCEARSSWQIPPVRQCFGENFWGFNQGLGHLNCGYGGTATGTGGHDGQVCTHTCGNQALACAGCANNCRSGTQVSVCRNRRWTEVRHLPGVDPLFTTLGGHTDASNAFLAQQASSVGSAISSGVSSAVDTVAPTFEALGDEVVSWF